MATSENIERVSCTVDECNTTFSRHADMERHVTEHHGPIKRCPVLGCLWEGARRSSRVQEHMKKAHPEIYNVALTVPSQFEATSVSTPLHEDSNQEQYTSQAQVTQPDMQGFSAQHDPSAAGSEMSNPAQFTPTNQWQSSATEPYGTVNEDLSPHLPTTMALPAQDYQNMLFQTAIIPSEPPDSTGISSFPDEDDSLVEPEETMEAEQHYSWSI